MVLKETMAIELRYAGNTAEEIAEKIDVPQRTIEGWFKVKGKLNKEYNDFEDAMNAKRRNQFESRLAISDEELLVTTTNVLRQYARKFQTRKVPLVNKDGCAVADENGHVIMIDVEPDVRVSMNDVKNAVYLQRLIRGLPNKVEIDEDAPLDISMEEVIRRLGITAEDMLEENYGKTMHRVANFLTERKNKGLSAW